ncbi:hypothetical protein ACWT_5665 [Actinoplanes sp. SE50]|uniref:hypothetical protein n=1 Tax=unclassified Actinoplanes TaxID=2626549 RepID=UPI00023ED2C0|nr:MULTISPECIES: hypothetical protein [unclassified Actinoplanes]AEV86682.1 hypothetical protein ACPL_5795 [Actinoplanes sp. SE50/110]ATO85080.1 hypothetical protein ACWT_5665 [Actinoplanes sp. SE50]SLM02491.1 hypothetical protein ACSP50_5741 [Actinoplanes sp. SE50/110]
MTDLESGSATEEIYNPVTVEQAIQNCADRIAKGVRIVASRYKTYQAAKRTLDRARAQAFLHYPGTQAEKKHAAELATIEERDARDSAYEEYKYARELAAALEDELRALQSINKSVTSAYNAVGVNR